jgi:uncharacterized protein (TIGR02598 family)
MEKCFSITPKSRLFAGSSKNKAGFSLVEIALAIGIVAFGIVAVFGLLPLGMNIFRQSTDTTVGSQIFQQIVSEAQETDFDQLIKDKTNSPISAGGTGVKTIRYFDNQGNELKAAAGAIYYVNTRIQPATDSPANPPASNPNLATVTIQVANNPGGRSLAYEQASPLNNLWSGAYDGNIDKVVSIYTASAMVSRQ